MDITIYGSVFGLVFLAELGDKTQLATMALATRYPWPKVFLGVAAAFVLLSGAAVGAGQALFLILPRFWILLASAALFLAFGISSLRAGEGDEGTGAPLGPGGPVVRSFLLILLAELGDKTQLATASLAAQYDSPFGVFTGSTLALWSVSLLGILVGRKLLLVVPLRVVHKGAGVLFLAFAAAALVQAFRG